MARLVDELLEVSRLEVGGFVLRRARIDLRETLHRALAHYAAEASDRLRALPGSAPVLVDADAQRMEEVIDNLVANALKYGRDEPVDIELMTSEGLAVLRVRDRGIGIPAPDRSQLFTAFFRTSNSVNIGGTGLGLFISRRIAELHGGRLSLSETGPKGSVFTLELPLAE
jgi:signal transduction histidine kinase